MADYRLDPGLFRQHVLNADFMVAAMAERGEKVKALAEATAPVDAGGAHPGRYRDSFHLEVGKDGGIHGDRAYATVFNDAETDDGQSLAVFVEYGTENNPAHHTMLRALDALG